MIGAMVPALHGDRYRCSYGLRGSERKYHGVINQGTAISLRDGRRQCHADGGAGSGERSE